MDFLFNVSVVASFLAGMVALFAPCCVTVLLPAYLASVFREKKKILRMTFVFFVGIAVIIIPIGLGAAVLAEVFKKFHRELYIAGGILMLFFGLMSMSGKGFALMPIIGRRSLSQDGEKGLGAKAVFSLGVFSGAATSCCAPVLAGVMTLAVVSAVFWKALLLSFSYVFGMVLPLFIIGFLWDGFNISKNKWIYSKANFIASLMFMALGALLIVLALSGNVFWAPSFQAELAKKLVEASSLISEKLNVLSEAAWGLMVVLVFLLLVLRMLWKNDSR